MNPCISLQHDGKTEAGRNEKHKEKYNNKGTGNGCINGCTISGCYCAAGNGPVNSGPVFAINFSE